MRWGLWRRFLFDGEAHLIERFNPPYGVVIRYAIRRSRWMDGAGPDNIRASGENVASPLRHLQLMRR